MSRPRIKICGLTRREDAALAVKLGADALGFVLWPKSPRAVTPDAVRAMTAHIPPFVTRVGVFVNASATEIRDAVRVARLDVVQLHGDEPESLWSDVGVRVLRSVALAGADDVARAAAIPVEVTPLVDFVDTKRRGGTGHLADWPLAATLSRRRPIVLAGGLTAENVASAIRTVAPWGIDVSSGVETDPGIKSAERLQAFFQAAYQEGTSR